MRITLPENGSVDKCWEVYRLAKALLEIHGLSHWTIQWDRAKNRSGQCRYGPKVISLSAPIMSIWPIDQARDCILHEIAHALTQSGHDRAWRATCMQIGAKPDRCWDSKSRETPDAKYIGTCPQGHKHYRNRLTKKAHRVSCGRCSNFFDARYKIKWELA